MKNRIKLLIGVAALLATVTTQAQSISRDTNFQAFVSQATTGTNALAQLTRIPVKVARDGYLVLKNLSFTNPIQANLFGLENGSGNYGFGLELNQAAPDSPVSVGFGVAAIQTEDAGKKSLNFYDTTVNIGLGDTINFPGTKLPLNYRVFSGPFTKLNNSQGGVYVGEESGAVGEMNFILSRRLALGFGGGVVNCTGAAAAGLKPAMPIAKLAFTWAPKGW